MNKIKYMSGIVLLLALALVSCSDKPSAENYSTFTARMMSDYLKEFPEYSYFTEIINHAVSADNGSTSGRLMDQLSALGLSEQETSVSANKNTIPDIYFILFIVLNVLKFCNELFLCLSTAVRRILRCLKIWVYLDLIIEVRPEKSVFKSKSCIDSILKCC